MKRRAFVRYPVHALLLHFSAELEMRPIYNLHRLAGLSHAECEESSKDVNKFEETGSNKMGGTILNTSELFSVQYSFELTTRSRACNGNVEIEHNVM